MSEIVDVNGTRLYGELVGDEDAPVVVFIHGFSLDTRTWDRQVEAFSDRYRVLRYDLRGFGRSAVPEPDAPYQHQADLAALLDRFGIEQAYVVGLSLGGAVALDFALLHPERVSALVLVGSIVPGLATPDLAEVSRTVWRAGKAGGAEAAKAVWINCTLFESVNQQTSASDAVRAMVTDYSGWGWTNGDPGTWAERNIAERLADVAAPTLIVVGEHDIVGMRNNATELARGIPGAELAVLPVVGHLPNIEDPVSFNRTVRDFLDALA